MSHQGKYASILYYAIILMSIIISLFLLYASMLKLVDFPGMEESFFYWGFSKNFMYTIGVIELLLAIFTFVPQTRIPAVIGVLILMTGALYIHLLNIEYDQLTSAIFLITLSILIIAFTYIRNRLLRLS